MAPGPDKNFWLLRIREATSRLYFKFDDLPDEIVDELLEDIKGCASKVNEIALERRNERANANKKASPPER